MNQSPTVSICIVSFNALEYLEKCLLSLRKRPRSIQYQIIVVDNASQDESKNLVRKEFSEVLLIENQDNLGFSKATNQAMLAASGEYLLWLNSDTIVSPEAIEGLVQFLANNPKCGIVGPKILNSDGTFQPQCKRGLPTPWNSFVYLTRFYRLFPSHPKFTQYLLSHLDEDHPNPVTSVSGACLLCNREVLNQIGLIDENIFAFGEDLDWCLRANQAGWEVWYYPYVSIIHFGGKGGSASLPLRRILSLHQAMWIFFKKHFKQLYPRFVTPIIWLAIQLSFLFSVTRMMINKLVSNENVKLGSKRISPRNKKE